MILLLNGKYTLSQSHICEFLTCMSRPLTLAGAAVESRRTARKQKLVTNSDRKYMMKVKVAKLSGK